jgi:hypothetical protein
MRNAWVKSSTTEDKNALCLPQHKEVLTADFLPSDLLVNHNTTKGHNG